MACHFSFLVPFLEDLGEVDRRKATLGSSVGGHHMGADYPGTWLPCRAWRSLRGRSGPGPGGGSGWGWLCWRWAQGRIQGMFLVAGAAWSSTYSTAYMLFSPYLKLGLHPPCPPWSPNDQLSAPVWLGKHMS